MRQEKKCPQQKRDISTHAGKLRFQQPPVTASVRDSSGIGNIYRKRNLYRCNIGYTFSSHTMSTAIAQQFECVGVQPQQNIGKPDAIPKNLTGSRSDGCLIMLLFDSMQTTTPSEVCHTLGALRFQLNLSYNNHFPCWVFANLDEIDSC